MNHQAQKLKHTLSRMELDGRYAADFRRLVCKARCRIMACEQAGDAEAVNAAVSEAEELLTAWDGHAGAPTR